LKSKPQGLKPSLVSDLCGTAKSRALIQRDSSSGQQSGYLKQVRRVLPQQAKTALILSISGAAEAGLFKT
jgi:hypothetical protein